MIKNQLFFSEVPKFQCELTSDAPTARLYISIPASANAKEAAVIDAARTANTQFSTIYTEFALHTQSVR